MPDNVSAQTMIRQLGSSYISLLPGKQWLSSFADNRSRGNSRLTGMDDKTQTTTDLVTAAMALRVKYRKTNANGTTHLQELPIRVCGVHKRNRGGIYPAGVRCCSLCTDVIEAGFVKEEVNHTCIAVEEIPVEIVSQQSSTFQSSRVYNMEKHAQIAFLRLAFSLLTTVSISRYCHTTT